MPTKLEQVIPATLLGFSQTRPFAIIPKPARGSNKQAVSQAFSILGVDPPTIQNQTLPAAKTTTGNPKTPEAGPHPS
jgi:hypothetical protein